MTIQLFEKLLAGAELPVVEESLICVRKILFSFPLLIDGDWSSCMEMLFLSFFVNSTDTHPPSNILYLARSPLNSGFRALVSLVPAPLPGTGRSVQVMYGIFRDIQYQ
jgi:hypothetical protein